MPVFWGDGAWGNGVAAGAFGWFIGWGFGGWCGCFVNLRDGSSGGMSLPLWGAGSAARGHAAYIRRRIENIFFCAAFAALDSDLEMIFFVKLRRGGGKSGRNGGGFWGQKWHLRKGRFL